MTAVTVWTVVTERTDCRERREPGDLMDTEAREDPLESPAWVGSILLESKEREVRWVFPV